MIASWAASHPAATCERDACRVANAHESFHKFNDFSVRCDESGMHGMHACISSALLLVLCSVFGEHYVRTCRLFLLDLVVCFFALSSLSAISTCFIFVFRFRFILR